MTRTPLDGLDEIATPDQWHEIVSRQPTETPEEPGASPSTRRRVVAGVVALAIAVVVVAVLVVAFRTGEGPGPARETPLPPSSYSTRETRLAPGSADIVVGEGVVWVAEPNAVVGIDPTTAEVLHHVDIQGVSEFSSFTVGGGAVWVTAHDPATAGPNPDVVRIDASTGVVADRVVLSSDLLAIAYSDGDLIYGQTGEGNAMIVRFDPDAERFHGSVGTGGFGSPSTIVSAGGAFWVGQSDYGPYALTRVPADFSDVKTIHGIASVGSMAAAGGYLWVQSDALYQVDLVTGDIVSVHGFPRLGAVASDGTQLWVMSATGSKNPNIYVPDPTKPATVTQLDPQTGEPVGDPVELEHFSPATLAVGAGGAWVSFYDDGVVVNVLPRP